MNNTVVLQSSSVSEKYRINQLLFDFCLVFNSQICSGVICLLGIFGNIVNIINFHRQGFSDSVTVTLTALAISDLGALVTQEAYNIMINPWLCRAELNFSLFFLMAVTIFYPQGYFIRVSGLITTFAAFERCMSVILPLKVRLIFTKKVALVVNVSIFLTMFMYPFPVYYVLEFVYAVVPSTNRTILTMRYRNNGDYVLHISYLLTDLTLPYFTFIVNVICTIVITVQLRTQAKWRTSVSGKMERKDRNMASSKEKKTAAMLVTVSLIFIVCLIPHSSVLTALSVVRELKMGGAYFDIALVCYSFTLLMETINCSVSILVYYRMSSSYCLVTKTQSLQRVASIFIPSIGQQDSRGKTLSHPCKHGQVDESRQDLNPRPPLG
ncbi:hypothetical protein Btru_059234 [Bulinus truncatus]|nr:hypothetical protein Btru_059234 [Bulinus truncatus]